METEDVFIVTGLKSETKEEINIDYSFKVNNVKACINASGKFFILANKLNKVSGVFLIELDENKPVNKDEKPHILLNW